MTIVIHPEWMSVPVLAALVIGTISLVLTVLVVLWAVVTSCMARVRRPTLYGLKLWGGF